MLNDTLRGVRERRGRRWLLLIPVATCGAVVMAVVTAVPWLILDCNGGAICAFIPWYSVVVFASVLAPKGKRIIALLVAAFAVILAHYYIRWDAASSWTEIDGRRVRDPDAFDPWSLWFGALAGTVTALALILFRRSARWLLFFPAFIVAFDGAFLLGLVVLGPLGNTIGNWIWLPVIACGLIGSATMGYWIAPMYKLQSAFCAGLIPFALIGYRLLADP